MNVTYGHIQAAGAILARIAFSRGETADPAVTLAIWRRTEGFEEDAAEQHAVESAASTMAEIEQMVEEGEPLTPDLMRQFIERDYLAALMTGWIVRARHESQATSDEEKVREAAASES